MWITSLSQRLSSVSPSIVQSMLDVGLKGFAILLIAWIATLIMRRASAASRHLVWLLGSFSLMVLPLLTLALPGWHVLPRWQTGPVADDQSAVVADAPDKPAEVRPVSETQLLPNYSPPAFKRNLSNQILPPATVTLAPAPKLFQLNWQAWIVLGWLAVGTMYLSYILLGVVSLWWMGKRSIPITSGRWMELLAEASQVIGFHRPIELLSSPHRSMPMTWGIWSTRILMPIDSTHWTQEQQRAVLLHELAHARRFDCLTQLLTHFICAVYWMNPLVWVALREMQFERERACDDLVLIAGAKASAYAEQLLHIAADLSPLRFSSAAISVARRSTLEGRLLSILDVKRNRRALSWGALLLALGVVCLIAVPVAMLRAASDPPAIAQTKMPATAPAESAALIVEPMPDVVGCRLRTTLQTRMLPVASNSVTSVGSATMFEQSIPRVEWTFGKNAPTGITHYAVVVFPVKDPDLTKIGDAEMWRRLKAPDHPAWNIDRNVGGVEYSCAADAPADIRKNFQNLLAGNYAFYILAYNQSPEPVAFAGLVLRVEPLPFTQIAVDEIEDGGSIHFRNISQSMNNTARTWKQGGFINSPFVQVSSIADDQGRAIDFSSENQGNHIQYRYTLNDPVQPGQAMIYAMEGTQSGLVQKLTGKGEYQYKMTHSPSAGQPVHRIEYYVLPRFAELIDTVPPHLPQRMRDDGCIEVLHEELIPTDGNITTAIHYKVPRPADQPMGQISQLVHYAVITISTHAQGDPEVAKALKMLQGLDEPRSVAETAKYLSSDQDNVRRAAIYVLWRSDFKSINAAADPLIKLCSHKEDLTRGMAALALGGKKVAQSKPALVAMLSDDKNPYARRCAAYALGLLGDRDAVPVLEKASEDPDPSVANNAKSAIMILNGPSDAPPLE